MQHQSNHHAAASTPQSSSAAMDVSMSNGDRATIYIAPLQITGAPKRQSDDDWSHVPVKPLLRRAQTAPTATHAETPQIAHTSAWLERIDDESSSAEGANRGFLRAFCAFESEETTTSSTVTLPLREGDVILVHSVHSNGWADGTLLASGARGWLPTNYCDTYDPPPLRVLLDALLELWDSLRGESRGVLDLEHYSDCVRAIVGGVRHLLEHCDCLTRESSAVKAHEVLRRNRRVLLAELSALVKLVKHFKEVAQATASPDVDLVGLINELTLKAFKVVMRGVKVLDISNGLLQLSGESGRPDRALVEQSPAPSVYGAESSPTPKQLVPDDVDHALTTRPPTPLAPPASGVDAVQLPAAVPQGVNRQTDPIGSFAHILRKRPNTSISELDSFSHHLASSSSAPLDLCLTSNATSTSENNPSCDAHLVSRRLSAAHDRFLSHQGSFIGRLHLQARYPGDLLYATQQSVVACRELLKIVEAVCERDPSAGELQRSKDAMCAQMADLVQTTKDSLQPRSPPMLEETGMMTISESQQLMSVATRCVRAAGECVAKSRSVIQGIGDFELAALELDMGADATVLCQSAKISVAADHDDEVEDDTPFPDFPLPPSTAPSTDGHGSERGRTSDSATPLASPLSAGHSLVSPRSDTFPILARSPSPSLASSTRPSTSSSGSGPTELVRIRTTECTAAAPMTFSGDDFNIGSAGTNNTSFSSLAASEFSTVSRTSTRATSPDYLPPSPLTASWPGQGSDKIEDEAQCADDGCERPTTAAAPVKSFAHELVYNKEGQIVGGTLPALVERLTMHDATPDSAFVSAFYLTFRLFTSALAFAEALIDRFEYVDANGTVAGPVRLRVYNILKGWLESHWHKDHDCIALPTIIAFATSRLPEVLPGAGHRLGELAIKASAVDGPLVPRLLSSLGKASTAAASHGSATTSPPVPVISRSQMAALKGWKQGGAIPGILELDPLELARQLTIRESKMFCAILPEELLAQEWTRRAGSRAVHVRAMSTFSTNLATLVAETILRVPDVKKRALVIKHWVKISRECLALHNYDSLMAIICALHSSNILRLKKTWEALSQKTLTTLEQLGSVVDVSRNYAVLRQRLQDHVSPCLPFVGLYLTDLTFVDVGNHTTRQLQRDGDPEGRPVINFDKHMRTAKIIGELQRFQVPYALTEVPELQDLIQAQIESVRASDDSNLQSHYRRSLLLEPREACYQNHRPTMSESLAHQGGGMIGSSSSSASSSSATAAASTTTSTTGGMSGIINATTSSTRDRFDLFSWASSSKEKLVHLS